MSEIIKANKEAEEKDKLDTAPLDLLDGLEKIAEEDQPDEKASEPAPDQDSDFAPVGPNADAMMQE